MFCLCDLHVVDNMPISEGYSCQVFSFSKENLQFKVRVCKVQIVGEERATFHFILRLYSTTS